jgi:general secretion pathway protein F
MPEFVWRAAETSGAIVQGQIMADNDRQAFQLLRARGLTPLKVADAALGGLAGGATPAGSAAPLGFKQSRRVDHGPVQPADVLALTSELAIMLRAGLPLANALRILIEMSHKPSVGALVESILKDVKGGAPLSRALAKNSHLFGDFYINMVRSGEASGQLADVLTRLVEHLQRLRSLRDSVVSAAMYPAILLVVALLSLVGMLGFVVPQFEKLFTDMGDALPLPTRWVMVLGQAFQSYGVLMLAVGALVLWLFVRWMKSPSGQAVWQPRLLRMPVLGPLVLNYQLTLYARSLGTLLGNGVPMMAALQIATETVGNTVLRQALARMQPQVKEGGRMADAMVATQIFAPLAINLVRVGEETGRIGPMMLELAAILNNDVETGIKRALTLVEPILILVLGVMVAAIIVSILMGIMSVNDLAI